MSYVDKTIKEWNKAIRFRNKSLHVYPSVCELY